MIWAMLLSTAMAIPPLEEALTEEMNRAMSGLKLPDAPTPYLIAYDLLDGDVITAQSSFGRLVSLEDEDFRTLRTEVRVGSYQLDSSNFSAFGEPDGIVSRRLPVEDNVLALRREVWLSTDEAYKSAVQQLSRKLAARQGEEENKRSPDYTPAPPVIGELASLPALPPVDSKALTELTDQLSRELRAFPELEVGDVLARIWQGRRLLLSSEGSRLWRNTGFVVVRVEGVVRLADGTRHRNLRSWVVRSMADLPPLAEMQAEVRSLGSWLSGMKTAPLEEDYLGPVLFERGAAIELFSQLLPAEIVGTPPVEEEPDDNAVISRRAPMARLGRRLLPVGWTVVDDPTTTLPLLGAYDRDQEGVAPRAVEVIHDGVLRDLLMSRIPSRDRSESTGHGRSLSNDRRGAMPGVLTVKPPHSLSEGALRRRALRLAAQVGRPYVLVVRAMEPPAMIEDFDVAITGDAPLPGLTFPTEVYRLYRDGTEEPVRSMEFVGVDRRVLRDIDRAGPMIGPVDMLDGPPGPERFQIGAVGGLGVTWTVPSVLITELELVGRRGGEPRILKLPGWE
ncbi:MAG TPA: metallopeptidase TldD-related protein [Myxococcota bacterium]|nr:metallopeptidase TldD-related protein [Myxococcota bacterium]